ncbi:hypothetical protein FKR81_09215 [Lentzea tibetensis]|uniref:Secreted protein n=1 Tax=Lentzea tibetensis TaxID=2591470 RepID=A0A563EXQ6_9PSEU|nr:hypothetical protein [Lentzea tibetensis]TWP52495.1 hypothetical protein FKR81_09215 [Lentzea tibetensis]
MTRWRYVLPVASIAALLFGGVHTATASPVDTTMSLDTASISSVGPLDASGCSLKTCIKVTGNAAGYTTSGSGSGFCGHIRVWGPRMVHDGPFGCNPAASGSGWGTGTTCAEGWEHMPDGSYQSRGRACKDVR